MAQVRKRTWKTAGVERSAWVADYRDLTGKRRLKTFATRKAADAWLVEARHEISLGVHTAASASITIAQAGDLWFDQCVSDGLERSTLAVYRTSLNRHIKPKIGTVRLTEFTPGMVQEFRNKLVAEGRSPAMRQKVMTCLGAMIANAMALGKVGRNVVRDQGRSALRQARLDKRHARQLEIGEDVPSKDEIRAMITHAQGIWRPFIITAVFTGLRSSELRGLRWRDVDLKDGELTVRQRADMWRVIGSTKSHAAKRTIPLAPLVGNALREWRLACPKSDGDLVFPNPDGRPLVYTTVLYCALVTLQRAAGIIPAIKAKGHRPPQRGKLQKPKYGMHAFRHAAASLFIEQGFSPKRVQALMGHSSIQMTFDRYGHLFPTPEDDQAAMKQLQVRLIGA